MHKSLIIILLLVAAIAGLMATQTVFNLNFEQPVFTTEQGKTILKLSDSQIYGNSGSPALPYRGVKLLLPAGEEAVSIVVERLNTADINGSFVLSPIGIPQTFDQLAAKSGQPQKDAGVYGSDVYYPTRPDNGIITHYLSGYAIAFTAVTPYEYNPVTQSLKYSSLLRITIESQPSATAQAASRLIKNDAFTISRLSKAINNTTSLPRSESRPGAGYDYIMIIDQAKTAQWQPLKDFYEQKGMSVRFETIQSIQQSQSGADLQMKLRNYLTTAYTDNPLKYVLLCGDDELIPHRGFYVNVGSGIDADADIPADMYFSCLDGNWNNDNDANWGETNEADLAPEFAIGRICYNNDTEIANQINKIMMYQTIPVENQVKTAFFAGEWLWDGPTWAGDYMDEMIGGSDMHGYTTVGVPATWDISTLYDRTYGHADAWNSSDIFPLLSAGSNLVNHLGHSNTTYNMRIFADQVTTSNITNNGVNHNYSIYFTQGCYAGAFDNRDTAPGQYGGDCITERFTGIATAAAGMIAHSRYGWGQQGSTNGASQYFHRQYIDALLGENIHELGYALVDSKLDNIPFMANQAVMYWVDYETNLIGDPAMMIWTDTPQYVTINTPNPWIVGQNQYQVTTNAPNAEVRLSQNGITRFQGTTDAAGVAIVSVFTTLTPGQYDLYINAPNFYPSYTAINVQASTMPFVVCTNAAINNPDNLLQAGETFSLNVTLKNIGMVDQAQSGTLTLSSTSPFLTIHNASVPFSALAVQDSVVINGVFNVQIGSGFADLANATLSLTAQFDGNSSQRIQNIVLNAPVLQISGFQIDNEGSPILPGDSPDLYITVQNSGTGAATGVMVLWMDDNPYITLGTQETLINHIAPGASAFVSQPLSITVSPTTPLGTTQDVNYYIGAESGAGDDGNLSFYVGMLNYSFEPGWENWTHLALNADFTDQWDRNSTQQYTGTWSAKFGGAGVANYTDNAFGALVSPEITLGNHTLLKFNDKMGAELSTSDPGMAWDGGCVEMSLNGGQWIQIAPEGGYPYLAMDNPASPFAADTPLLSGEYDWTEKTFDLSAFAGSARFRFVFGSDGGVTGEGWYIDNVRIEMDYTGTSDDLIPAGIKLMGNYPNPFNPHTAIRFALPAKQNVTLEIYNVKGQLVKTMINHTDKAAGTHELIWNGRDNHDQPAGSGMYLYRLQSGNITLSRKMMLLK